MLKNTDPDVKTRFVRFLATMGLAEIIVNYESITLWASSLEIVNIIWVGDWKTSNSFSRQFGL
jgi:hypothetical protein